MSAPARTLPGDKGTADRIEADDGAYWVRLVTRQALDREGAWMDHCVGDGDFDRLAGGEELTDDAIWSLRDADGTPRLTVQISADRVVSANGYRNHQPSKGATIQVRHLVAAFAAVGVQLAVSSPVTNIVLAPDGRTFRRDRVPAEVQVALDAAERERRAERERELVTPSDVARMRMYSPAAPLSIASVNQLNGVLSFTLSDGTVIPPMQVELRSNENPHRPLIRTPEPRLGLLMLEEATSEHFYELGGQNGHAYDVEVFAATAAGADIVSGEDYVVDHGLGIIQFKRDLRDVQVLWQQAPSVAQNLDRDTAAALLGTDHLAVRFEQERASVRSRRAGLFAQAEDCPWDHFVCAIDTQAAP